MSRHELRFRQIHLDFHTSPMIPGIGKAFDRKLWQERLQMAHVDSITCFSCCHHGYSYHPTKVGEIHPGLDFDLLRAQIDACHEINVKVPIYITAGVNNRVAEQEPGWRELNFEGRYVGWQPSPVLPGFKSLCFNSPYMDYLCRLIEEAARLFPDADGMFFDIIGQNQCCCPWCMRDMKKAGFDPTSESDRKIFSDQVIEKYMKRSTEAARSVRADMPVLHNAGHYLGPGFKHLAKYFSHLELESLPTGGWGYDHYPLMAAYCRTQELDFLGMTGKFHSTWGEFGGFKSANALRYECCAMLAQGSKCSVGDQLHPAGMPDESTYRLIGEAYADVEKKEPWCSHVSSTAEVAILSNEGVNGWTDENGHVEIGISRFLLESHIPFDRLDSWAEFDNYKVLILGDNLRCDGKLLERVKKFIANGGKVILSGTSIFKKECDEAAFDLPVEVGELNMQIPNFIKVAEGFAPEGVNTPFVMYRPSVNIKVTGGRSLGELYEPYFTRNYEHFCSHQHTPNKTEPSGYAAGVMTEDILYFAHPVFTLYAYYGNVLLKQFLLNAVKAFVGREKLQVVTDLPSQGRVSLLEQKEEKRYIFHALYAVTSLRGMATASFMPGMRATSPVEVIEDLTPVYNVNFEIKVDKKVVKAKLVPENVEIPFVYENGKVKFTLEKLQCHQMVELDY